MSTRRRRGAPVEPSRRPGEGTFVGAALIEVDGIGDLEREVFGPVLHVASFKAQDIDRVIARSTPPATG
jgi:RHH-type proline utilization regulon transcriptional repressor/proline dehydrogenase/delta 1-pyrroline-5-carboxylate dehydrogenase